MKKLATAFWIWGIFGEIYGDFDNAMAELKERGFNCIRLEDGAGLMCSLDGTPRGDVSIHKPFGEYDRDIRQFIVKDGVINIRKRLLELFSAAEKHDIQIILSSWYYLHTNWFLGDEINNELLALSTAEKFEYFSDELSRILDFIREHNFIHRVAFAEIFNEIDGHDFAENITDEEAIYQRELHEKAIDKLKKKHPDVLFACDLSRPYVNEKILPSNADILNFHSYYAWGVYECFEKDVLKQWKFTPETTQFMKESVTSPEMLKATFSGRNISVREGWIRRICLYHSVDSTKLPQLEMMIAEYFDLNYDRYIEKLEDALEHVVAMRDRTMPDAKLFMGEGVTYCAHNHLNFEEKSRKFQNMLLYQAKLFSNSELLGCVVRTTSGPEDVSWELLKDVYKKANKIFLSENV